MKKTVWQRPKTTKVYLQRPLSERIALLCPDFKLLSLPLQDNGIHVGQLGVGLLFLHGDDMIGFDLDETRFSPVQWGIPIYEVVNRGECLTRVEAFASGERNPTLFFRLTLENDSYNKVESSIGFLPRSGQEKYMLNQHQEGYSPYRPNEKNWYMLKRTWKQTEKRMASSDMGHLYIDVDSEWITSSKNNHAFAAADYFKIDYSLAPGDSLTVCGALRAGEPIDFINFDYDKKRQETVEFWEGELAKIAVYPNTTDESYLGIYEHAAVQCLQMLARYEGLDSISVRQGDVGRFVWPYEGAQVLVNLDRIGLSEHTGAAYRGYIERWFTYEGDDRGKIGSQAGWENFTGSVLWGISEHLKKTQSLAEFEYFKPYLIAMRDWIERRRKQPRQEGFEGIFPPGVGSDWSERGQFWTFTDSHNCMALRSLCEALEYFDSDEYTLTREIYEDYSEVICDIRDLLYRQVEDEEACILPHMLGIEFEDSENYSYYTDGAPYLLYTGFIEPDSEIRHKMEKFFRERGQFERGLTGRMTSCASMWDEAYFGGYGDVWYTMQSETYWVRAWCASGEYEKAKESLDACLTYGMTEEGIVSERYCSINPWYCPWQPNGSGSSRVIEMMLTYFGKR